MPTSRWAGFALVWAALAVFTRYASVCVRRRTRATELVDPAPATPALDRPRAEVGSGQRSLRSPGRL
ncbi:hypothetical protein GV794_22400 [Nocardia cyriacigeorgica]|uniref:Uncharacterized protein n=1 Tax=Nocardia cyriacigeorgica TaxID=135487 RepID=A0A6P1D205_9NOCA|nr:hypothetical protein [Nocardia cyriacigeorgica]NEW41668.1 hypothetical protein [Nocardia cyriacigeorgica]NEW44585.1 hypothetical protein [Nocardia cyriacigeorgica]NEW51915.1 hypothetical protein [Nocardia cyriacigeorgica]NEW58378.1 hypothetical protein [Nocardia cyriacigeorgica]